MEDKTIRAVHFFDQKSYTLKEDIAAPIIVGYELRTPANMGFILRLAANIGAKKVLFSGDDDLFRPRKIQKTAQTAYQNIDWEFCSNEAIASFIPSNYEWIAIETSSQSQNCYATNLPKACAFFIGNETVGLSENILAQCNQSVHIPMTGPTLSMNVSHALTVVLFEWLRQHLA